MERTGKKDDAELIAKIIAMSAVGNTQKEIGKSLGLGLNTINEILNIPENTAMANAARKTIKEKLINQKLEEVTQAFVKNCELATQIIDKNLTRINNGVANLIPKELQNISIVLDIAHKNLRLARGESTENVAQNVRHFSFVPIKQGEVIEAKQ